MGALTRLSTYTTRWDTIPTVFRSPAPAAEDLGGLVLVLFELLAKAADLALLVLRCVANSGHSTGQRVDPQPTQSGPTLGTRAVIRWSMAYG